MPENEDHNPAKNKRSLKTERMRREGWEGAATEVAVSLITKSNSLKRGAPIDQPIQRDLKNAIALIYMGIFYRNVGINNVRKPKSSKSDTPRLILDDEIKDQIESNWDLDLTHETLKKRASKAARIDPRYRSQKIFRDIHLKMGDSIVFMPNGGPSLLGSIQEQKRILDVLCKALERANFFFQGVRDVFQNDGRYGEPRSNAKQSAFERSLLLSPLNQKRLELSLSDMIDVALFAWVDPTIICLGFDSISPAFEALICAGRCRDGISGDMTLHSSISFKNILDGKLNIYCTEGFMFEYCRIIYEAACQNFNMHANFSPEEFKEHMQKELDRAIGGAYRLNDKITIHPLEAPRRPAT